MFFFFQALKGVVSQEKGKWERECVSSGVLCRLHIFKRALSRVFVVLTQLITKYFAHQICSSDNKKKISVEISKGEHTTVRFWCNFNLR